MRMERNAPAASSIIIGDSVIGGGKAMLGEILSTYEDTTHFQYSGWLERIADLDAGELIEKNAAISSLKAGVDEDSYNYLLGRHVNFRFLDVTSPLRGGNYLQIIKSLLTKPDENLHANTFHSGLPSILYVLHNAAANFDLFCSAFGEKLRFVELTRNPLDEYMIKLVAKWTKKWPVESFHGRLLYRIQEHLVPVDAIDIAEDYLDANEIERALLLLYVWSDQYFSKKQPEDLFLIVPFEDLVIDPYPWLEKVEAFLEKKPKKKLKRVLSRNGVPRKNVNDSPQNWAYRKHGLRRDKRDRKSILADARRFIRSESRGTISSRYLQLCERYMDEISSL